MSAAGIGVGHVWFLEARESCGESVVFTAFRHQGREFYVSVWCFGQILRWSCSGLCYVQVRYSSKFTGRDGFDSASS